MFGGEELEGLGEENLAVSLQDTNEDILPLMLS